MATPLLELQELTKSFGPVLANDRISLKVHAGRIHALVGENGAGKTTLMTMIAGTARPDSGVIKVDGRPTRITSPLKASGLGFGMVHQHFKLVPSLTVAANVFLGRELRTRPGQLDTAAMEQQVAELSQPVRARHRPASQGRRPLRRPAPAGRGAEGAQPRHAPAHPRRADRRADAERERRPVRRHPWPRRARLRGGVHLPQARRGAVDRGRGHRDPRRSHHRDASGGRPLRGRHRPDDGGPRGAAAHQAHPGATRSRRC